MKEYATVTFTQFEEWYLNASFSNLESYKNYQRTGTKTAFQMMIDDGWVVLTSGIQTHICNGERKYCFVLERDRDGPSVKASDER